MENDLSWLCRASLRQTTYVEMVGRQNFFAQSSVLSTQYLSIDADTATIYTHFFNTEFDIQKT